MIHASGLTPAVVLGKLASAQMIDVHIPNVEQRWLILPRYTQPVADVGLVLDKLKLELPVQPPSRVTAEAVARNAA